MIALERESEIKEPPPQKTRRQRREKTTGCGRDDVYREKGVVPGKTTPCILALGDLADILELVKRAKTLCHYHTPQQLAIQQATRGYNKNRLAYLWIFFRTRHTLRMRIPS